MKLLIAIPALNEEASIRQIIERSLAARQPIIDRSPVTEVEVTVVSDGSTDRTAEIARRYADRIHLIEFAENRGYGAAILEAWRQSDAEILGFLDADGTCDPLFFTELCNRLEEDSADVVLGCRLHEESRMPWVRRLGNKLFSGLLTVLSSRRVRDTASGMRVVRRTSLEKLMPLPAGLHFTPAMSARALLRQDVVIREIDMPYHERAGESKLHASRDGLRFLAIIFDAAFLYRPSRPLALFGIGAVAVASVLMVSPALFYLQNHRVEEWMIYRFIVSHLLASSGLLAVCAAHVSRKVVGVAVLPDRGDRPVHTLLSRLFASVWFWLAPLALAALGVALVVPSLLELAQTGATYEHWSRFIAMSFFLSSAFTLVVARVMDHSVNLIAGKLDYARRPPDEPPAEPRGGRGEDSSDR
jgi:glycosyltransferase involved in cell wall biosynthesis